MLLISFVTKYVFVFVGIKVVPNWPKIQDSDHLQLGQIGGVAVDSKGNIHVFHRGSRKWDATLVLFCIILYCIVLYCMVCLLSAYKCKYFSIYSCINITNCFFVCIP